MSWRRAQRKESSRGLEGRRMGSGPRIPREKLPLGQQPSLFAYRVCSWRGLCGFSSPWGLFQPSCSSGGLTAQSPGCSRCARHLPAGFKIFCLLLPAFPVGGLTTNVAQWHSRPRGPRGLVGAGQGWWELCACPGRLGKGHSCPEEGATRSVWGRREDTAEELPPDQDCVGTNQERCRGGRVGFLPRLRADAQAGGRCAGRGTGAGLLRRQVSLRSETHTRTARAHAPPGGPTPWVGRAALCQRQVQRRWVLGPLLLRNNVNPLINLLESLHSDLFLESRTILDPVQILLFGAVCIFLTVPLADRPSNSARKRMLACTLPAGSWQAGKGPWKIVSES